MEQFLKHSHPLKEYHKFLYNAMNGQVAPDSVNVQNSDWWTTEQWLFSISSTRPPWNYSEDSQNHGGVKKAVTGKVKAFYDMEVLSLVVGQQHGIDLTDAFDHELSFVPPSLIGEYGYLRKGLSL